MPGVGSMLTFAENDGYLEALLRGFKCGILVASDYTNLVQCDNLEGNFFSPRFIVGRELIG